MGFPILVRWHLYIESGPRLFLYWWHSIKKTLLKSRKHYSSLLVPLLYVQCGAVIMWYNMSWYYTQYYNHSSRTSLNIFELTKGNPLPSPLQARYGASIVRMLEKNDCVIMASHCIYTWQDLGLLYACRCHHVIGKVSYGTNDFIQHYVDLILFKMTWIFHKI